MWNGGYSERGGAICEQRSSDPHSRSAHQIHMVAALNRTEFRALL